MNKMLIFPMTIMLILTIYIAVATLTEYSSDMPDFEDIVGGGTSINIWELGGAVVILLVSVSISIACGIGTFMVDLSENAQKIIFNMSLFGGLWASLTMIANDFFFHTLILTLIWLGLTMIYVVGIGFQIQGVEGA